MRKRELVGKTIADIDWNRSWNKGHRGWIHDPIITFTDGTHLRFSVEETDDGSYYGVDFIYPARAPHSDKLLDSRVDIERR